MKVNFRNAVVATIWASLMLVGWCFYKNIPSFFSNYYRALIFFAVILLNYGKSTLYDTYRVNFYSKGVPEKFRPDLANLGSTVIFMMVFMLSPYSDASGDFKLPELYWIRLIGLILLVIAFIMIILAVITLGKYFSVYVTIQREHKLITNGIYSIIRHPRALGHILICLGVSLVFLSLIGLAVSLLMVLLVLWRLRREEQMLKEEFGEKWELYAKHTKKLIPFLY